MESCYECVTHLRPKKTARSSYVNKRSSMTTIKRSSRKVEEKSPSSPRDSRRKPPLPDFKQMAREDSIRRMSKRASGLNGARVSSRSSTSKRGSSKRGTFSADKEFFQEVSKYLHPEKQKGWSKTSWVLASATLRDVIGQMSETKLHRLWVVDSKSDKQVVGVISLSDVLRQVFDA